MKKTSLICTAVICMAMYSCFVACRKDQEQEVPDNSGEKYALKVQVKDFNQSVIDFPGGKTAASGRVAHNKGGARLFDHIDVLYFRIYNEHTGEEIFQAANATGLDSPGTFNIDPLPRGNYRIVAVGGSTHNFYYNNDRDLMGHITLPYNEAFFNTNSIEGEVAFPDIFYSNTTLNLQSDTSIMLTLPRITGGLRIIAEDVPDSSIYWLRGQITGDADNYDISANTPYIYGNLNVFPDIPGSVGSNTIMGYVLNTSTEDSPVPLTVDLYVRDTAGPVAHKIIENVYCYKNRITVLTGRVLSPVASTFKIDVLPAWSTDTTIIEY